MRHGPVLAIVAPVVLGGTLAAWRVAPRFGAERVLPIFGDGLRPAARLRRAAAAAGLCGAAGRVLLAPRLLKGRSRAGAGLRPPLPRSGHALAGGAGGHAAGGRGVEPAVERGYAVAAGRGERRAGVREQRAGKEGSGACGAPSRDQLAVDRQAADPLAVRLYPPRSCIGVRIGPLPCRQAP